MDFTPFITIDALKDRGYDLTMPGKLTLGSFQTPEEAAKDLIQECFDTIYNVIEEHRGGMWTKAFFEDMAEDFTEAEHPMAYQMKEALKWAILNHTIFILDNGDKEASSKIDNERLGISPKAIRKLYNAHILRVC